MSNTHGLQPLPQQSDSWGSSGHGGNHVSMLCCFSLFIILWCMLTKINIVKYDWKVFHSTLNLNHYCTCGLHNYFVQSWFSNNKPLVKTPWWQMIMFIPSWCPEMILSHLETFLCSPPSKVHITHSQLHTNYTIICWWIQKVGFDWLIHACSTGIQLARW